MSDYEHVKAALHRACELLNATQRFMAANPIAAEYTVLYDEAQCDGRCLAEDCRIAADDAQIAADYLERMDQRERRLTRALLALHHSHNAHIIEAALADSPEAES